MDRFQPTKRSASHGPLDRARGGNASFLLSPAPLDTMLRKTTETGDIGMFSIGPTRSLGRSRLPATPEPTRHKPASVMPPRIMGVQGLDVADDRRTLPSYRHSNSESDSASSGSRCFSLPSRIDSRRSDSMTTCSSGSASLQRSRPRPGRIAGGWKHTYPTRGSRSSDLSETSHGPRESRCHDSQEWATSAPGHWTSSHNERLCGRFPSRTTYQPLPPVDSLPGRSSDTGDKWRNPQATGQTSRLTSRHRGVGQASVFD